MVDFSNSEEVEKVVAKIREVRKEKGFSHEVVAFELGISPSAYNKLERMESKLTLERFLRIKNILERDFSDFFDMKTDRIYNQDIKDSSYVNAENLHQESKGVYEKLIQSKDEQIALLKNLLEKSR